MTSPDRWALRLCLAAVLILAADNSLLSTLAAGLACVAACLFLIGAPRV